MSLDGQSPPDLDVMMNKTVQEKADAVSAFINTARLSGGRATFMAGFAYYSIGRYWLACCDSIYYYAFNIAAVVFAFVVAGTCQTFVYYAQRLADPELQYEFCIQAIDYNRFLFRMNFLATSFYAIGIGLLSWAYYPFANIKWCPLILMIIITVALVPYFFKIAVSQLQLQTYGKKYVEPVDDKKLVKESPYGNENRSESLQDYLLKQANIISGRAIFISGLAQQGIMRFMPTPAVFSDDDHFANSFLVFISFAMALSYFAGGVFFLFQVFIPDTIKEKQLAFAILIQPVAKFVSICYVGSFFALSLGNMFVADGCNFDQLRGSSIFFGLLGVLLLAICIWKSAMSETTLRAINENSSEKLDDDAKLDKSGSPSTSDTVDDKKQLENKMLAINTAGTMSTFAAGYLYFNILAFDTDILRLPIHDNIDWMLRINFIINFVTVTSSLYASAADTILTININRINTVRDKLNYLQSRIWIVQSVVYGYYFSLVGWFASFSQIGFVKYSQFSYIPMVYAVIGVVVFVLGTVYLHYARQHVTEGSSADDASPSKKSSSEDSNAILSRPSNLTSLGFSVIFLGGFAYDMVNLFDFRDRKFEYRYLHGMCISFVTSMWVMVFADRYNYQINKCPTVVKKLSFARNTSRFYYASVICSYIVVISLLYGFSYLGYVKSISNYKDVAFVIKMCAVIIVLSSLPLSYWILSTFKTAAYSNEPFKVYPSENEIERFKNQVITGLTTSGFICGVVCYETFFSQANSDYSWMNKAYFAVLCCSFIFGLSAVIVSTLVLLCLGELAALDKKAYFVVTLRRLKLGIFILSMGSVIFWQTSLLASSGVKYTGEKGGDLKSFIPALLGLMTLTWYYYGVKKISDGIVQNGRTVTNAATDLCVNYSRERFDSEIVVNPMGGSEEDGDL